MIFNTSRIPSKIENELTVSQIISLQRPFQARGPVQITRASLICYENRAVTVFAVLRKKKSPIFLLVLNFAKIKKKRREIQNKACFQPRKLCINLVRSRPRPSNIVKYLGPWAYYSLSQYIINISTGFVLSHDSPYLQGPSFKLILWFLHNNTHLGLFFENIKVGEEIYAIQA